MVRLKKISVKNFKSFKNNTVPLDEGFTSIVGPNGSGKSNIIDAICFALGATSVRSLRATRLEDLLHSDVEDAKAEVVLHLDGEGEETIISRSISRDGKCTYKLDGKRCTKNLMIETLSSLGVPQNASNVVMQGDVTKVVEMNNRERRLIIDELSGIAEYNDKKEKSMRELEKVEEKIKEVNIVLGEKLTRLDELEKEREEALKYKDLKSRERAVRGSILLQEIKKLEKESEGIFKEFARCEQETKKLGNEKEEAEKQLKLRNKELGAITDEISRKMGGDTNIYAIIAELRNKTSTLGERISEKKQERLKIKERVRDVEDELRRLDNSLDRKRKELQKAGTEKDRLQAELSKEEAELAKFRKRFESGSRELYDSLAKVNDELTLKNREKMEAESRLEVLGSKKEMISEKAGKDKGKVKEMKERRTDLIHALDKSRGELEVLEKNISNDKTREKMLNQEYSEISQKAEKVMSRLNALSPKMSRLKGRGRSPADLIINARDGLKGIIGTVSDLCSYSSEHAYAIEAAAGARLSYIVTKDSSAAVNAVNYLKKSNSGRATFMPLDKLRDVRLSDVSEALKKQGVVGRALDLVKFDKKYEKAFRFVLGNTIVVKDLAVAKKVGISLYRMVTLDGDICEASGIISGGARMKTSLQLLKEYDNLEKELTALKVEKARIINSLEEFREALEARRDKKSGLEIRAKEFEVELRELEKQFSEVSGSDGVSTEEIEKEMEGIGKAVAGLDGAISSLALKKDEIQKELGKVQEKTDSGHIDEFEQKVSGTREKKSGVELQLQALKSSIQEITKGERAQLEKNLNELNTDLSQLQEEVEAAEKQRAKAEGELKEKQEEEQKLSSQLGGLNKKKVQKEREAEQASSLFSEISKKIDKLKDSLIGLSGRKTKYEQLLNDRNIEFGEYTDVKPVKKPLEELQSELAEYESGLHNLGDVNLKAIELYDVVNEKVGEFREKIEVLDKEREAVLGLMSEIEKKRVEVFMDTFNVVNANFKNIFEKLANGNARLVLEVPEAPLDSGLILEANPSGKTIRRIESMSGGEKALTALAFLFAIQQYEPSPFYLIDEADAALDIRNSSKVANMFVDLSNKTQFIVVSHNAPMIRKCDQMVGVTMDETGTSIVEVSMPEEELVNKAVARAQASQKKA